MKILLDTNAYVALMRGHTEVADRVRRATRVYLSAVVAGELLFWFRNGSRCEKNIGELEEFFNNPFVEFLSVSYVTADRFGRISAALKQ